ncbi:MAG: hypothetical protein ACPG5U_05745 [Planktomarina sp.]
MRDNAEDARSFLFNALLSLKNVKTLGVLHFLSQQPEFSHMPDRLQEIAIELTREISDVSCHTLEAFKAIDQNGAFVPFDNKSLLTAVMTRLDAFEHDMLHAEDTPVVALRGLDQETDLRRFIAHWLRNVDRGVFEFTQEAVVADEKRTDIRFHPQNLDEYATVELKREDWTIKQFETALETQLVGQYLRHERCKVGCLLICQSVPRYWVCPTTAEHLNLEQVVDHLQAIADDLMSNDPTLQLKVKGINYST